MSGAAVAIVHPDPATLAATTAARLLVRLVDLQSARSVSHIALTGGTVGIRTLAEIERSPLRDAVDWTSVHLWWGDERFLPSGDADRNETQAREALLDRLAIPAENVHPMPASDAPGIDSPEASAEAYAAELARFAAPDEGQAEALAVPAFDVVLLGMGPDAHVASLFPEHTALDVADRTVVGVHGSPKPPPERVSLTFPAIRAAAEVWLVVAGADKAPAVAQALGGADLQAAPAVGAVGRQRTLWLLDVAAAGPER